ncbi:MAG: site-2 protease family protein [Clostridia bacterium]|nr:site-2 protease family protein [Clostridia bacterium]
MINVIYLLGSFLAVMIVITLHEFAHAFIAYKCGDPTAKFSGRMTLNPIKHFDLLGILMFALAGFGWAKPVPVNPNNFKHYRSGSFWTSAAGSITNYLSAFLFCPIWALIVLYVMPKVQGMYMYYFLDAFFGGLVVSSLSFCVFNLLPFYPLDGFRMVDALNKNQGKVYNFLKQYGYYILLGLILLHILASRIPYLYYIDVLGYVLTFVKSILAKPITLFWEWIFKICGAPLRIIL